MHRAEVARVTEEMSRGLGAALYAKLCAIERTVDAIYEIVERWRE
jgi:hypothetical protein